MLVHADDFEVRPHSALLEPEIPEALKQQLIEPGTSLLNRVELLDLEDECFHCGAKLTMP